MSHMGNAMHSLGLINHRGSEGNGFNVFKGSLQGRVVEGDAVGCYETR